MVLINIAMSAKFFFGYVHHMHVTGGVGRECITFYIRLSVYARHIVFIQKVWSINVEMSSAAAAANFFCSLTLSLAFQIFCVVFGIRYLERRRKIVSSKHIQCIWCMMLMTMAMMIGTTGRVEYNAVPKSNSSAHCVHFSHFVVGWAWACDYVNVVCHKNLSSTFGFLAEAKRMHASHTNLTRSKLENNGKSFFFRGAFYRGDGLCVWAESMTEQW